MTPLIAVCRKDHRGQQWKQEDQLRSYCIHPRQEMVVAWTMVIAHKGDEKWLDSGSTLRESWAGYGM